MIKVLFLKRKHCTFPKISRKGVLLYEENSIGRHRNSKQEGLQEIKLLPSWQTLPGQKIPGREKKNRGHYVT